MPGTAKAGDCSPYNLIDLKVRAVSIPTEVLKTAAPARRVVTHPAAFTAVFALYVSVVVGRLGDVITVLQPFRLGMLSALAVVFLGLKAIPREDVQRFVSSPTGRSLIAVVAIVFLTIPTSVWPTGSVNFIRKSFYVSVVLGVMVALAFIDRNTMRKALLALITVVMIAALMPIVRPVAGRYMIGYTFDQNDTAMLLVMMIPWAIFLVMTEKGRGRWVGFVALPAYLVCVFKTGSRGGMLGLAALVPFLIYLSPPKRRVPFILAVLLVSAVVFAFQKDYVTRRFKNVLSGTDYNQTLEDGRIEVWKRGLRYFATHPVQGLGIDGFGVQELNTKTNKGYGIRMTEAHNMYVQVSAELGAVGFFFFLNMFWSSWRGCSRVRKRAQRGLDSRPDPRAYGEVVMANMARASLLGVMVTGFFLSSGYSAITYFSIGAALGVILGADQWEMSARAQPAPAVTNGRATMRGWRSARSARFAIDHASPPLRSEM